MRSFKFKKDDIANLKNIIWAIEKIEKSLNSISSADELEENEEKYDSAIVKLMNNGESSVNLSEDLKNKFPGVDWDGMYKMRNIIAHSYHKVDVNIVWDIAKNELPLDKKNVLKILNANQ
jgi:uncharacterized protein with HEPN domain